MKISFIAHVAAAIFLKVKTTTVLISRFQQHLNDFLLNPIPIRFLRRFKPDTLRLQEIQKTMCYMNGLQVFFEAKDRGKPLKDKRKTKKR